MAFWQSSEGEITGKAEDAFTKEFSFIPNNTTALASIKNFCDATDQQGRHYLVEWQITDGEFKGQVVNLKLRPFDSDSKRRHRALNFFKLLYDLFGLKPNHDGEPADHELRVFIGKKAGITIREWFSEGKDKEGKPRMNHGNYVSKVEPAQGFVSQIGEFMTEPPLKNSAANMPASAFVPAGHQSAFAQVPADFDDQLPF